MLSVVRIVDQVIKQHNAARCQVWVQQHECIYGPCTHIQSLVLNMSGGNLLSTLVDDHTQQATCLLHTFVLNKSDDAAAPQ